ncbi:SAM-dependent methyltransferase [Crossiella equi]|uniref:SAM-dependent methyltransferase n=1 Tax=Crossiella equi TaxID=130796 RepID=A0ABS5AJ73_9PSEU|nr:methyltransferase domain-containing protein [Crossiella equi]MBP2476623.1 SAM-dependent methyltransferase [Crossiella equi]
MTSEQDELGHRMVGGGAADLERLRLLQTSTDIFTQENITALSLPERARCLELGAGAGAVAAWLATEHPEGQVLAVDADTSALGSLPNNVTVEQNDITSPAFQPGEGIYDLVHCRFVLSHAATREELVRRAARWLRPGGWLILTEPFHLDPDTSPHPVVGRVLQAYWELAVRGGADLRWSRQIPFHLASAGLADVDFRARAGLLGGGSQDRWRPLLEPVAAELLRYGGVTQQDLDEVFELLGREDFLDIPQIIIAGWGRRPLEG